MITRNLKTEFLLTAYGSDILPVNLTSALPNKSHSLFSRYLTNQSNSVRVHELLYQAISRYQRILTQIEKAAPTPQAEQIFQVLLARDG